MNQLKQKGLITHSVISIYQNNEYGNSSYVKFGGWDLEALQTNTSLYMVKTELVSDWRIVFDYCNFGG